MNKSYAIKRLTTSDLTIFENHFRKNGRSKQKAINLNADVFARDLFPDIGANSNPKALRLNIKLRIWDSVYNDEATGCWDRVIIKSGKNWRIDGGLIKSKELHSDFKPGDLALLVFIGSTFPEEVWMYVFSQNNDSFSSIYDSLDRFLGASKMRKASEYEVSQFIGDKKFDDSNSLSRLAKPNTELTPMEIFDKEYDQVLKSIFCSGKATYSYAMERFFPRIDKYYAQRRILDEKFYAKLERDIISGCIMPPITIAIVVENIEGLRDENIESISDLIENKSQSIYILDGIQRLNTLHKVYKPEISNFKLYVNLLVSDSDDRLLYRMITLNNGQKPMSAKHQIEVLAHGIFDFGDVSLPAQSEKERSRKKIKGAFEKSDIIKGYIAYMSEEVNIDNQKIIESKLDELIAEKIIASSISESGTQFTKVIEKIEEFIDDENLHRWFKQPNNLIGFCAGMGKSFPVIAGQTKEQFANSINSLENAFDDFDVSKIKLGFLRRKLTHYFISNYQQFLGMDESDIRLRISDASIILM